MPNLDQTGPRGQGAGTGRRMGGCFGGGQGRGRGRRFVSPKNELGALEEEEKALEKELEIIREEKSALEAQK